MQIDEYWLSVAEALNVNQEWRTGQAAYNVLRCWRPDLAEQVVGTEMDPFYEQDGDPVRLRAFSLWVKENWGVAA